MSIFTRDEIDQFLLKVSSKFRGGIRSSEGIFSIILPIIGGIWASLSIPKINGSEISPETYGIYTIGFLVTVMVDGIITWKNTRNDNNYEQAIAVLFIIVSAILLLLASYLSIKPFHIDSNKVSTWSIYSTPSLILIFICSITMSIVLTGFESDAPVGAVDKPVADIKDRE